MLEINSIAETVKFFAIILGELILLFIGISFLVSLIQRYISKEKIQGVLSKPHKSLQNIFGAALGAITPFCSCSTVPILVGLFKSGAPFGSAISFFITSPILNPMIIILFLRFFGVKITLIYAFITFIFAVLIGTLFEKIGMEKEIKKVIIKGGREELTYDDLDGSAIAKNKIILKASFADAIVLFRQMLPYLFIGAAVGAIIYGFIPEEFIAKVAGPSNWFAVPVASVVGVPMYIRTETMVPIASVLHASGMSMGAVMALIIGGAGASIPEVTLLATIFKKKMMIAYLLTIFFVATVTGYAFNLFLM